MRTPLLASLLVAVALASSCKTLDDSKNVILKPSALSKDFKDLDDKDNPFAQKATRVDYVVSGVKTYDAFFKDAAEVKGVVVLADVVLKETDAYVAKVKKAGGKGSLSSKGIAEYERHQARLAEITGLLGKVPDRSAALLDDGEKLTAGAAKTFVGPNAFKLVGVTRGLDEARKDIQDAAKRAPGLVTHAGKSTAALVGL